MSTADRPPRLRLFDILDCVHQIQRNTVGMSFDQWRADILRYRAVERWLEIISEASRHLTPDMKAREAAIDWRQVGNFGNVLRHGYQVVDPRVMWNILTVDLPPLKEAAARLYRAEKLPADPWPDAEST
jgi:uncharacterized protein with HEPN domain